MAFMFEKLQVYQKAVAFADGVCTLTRSFPRGYFFLADQLNRAALSIVANINPFCRAVSGQGGGLLVNYPVEPGSDGTF